MLALGGAAVAASSTFSTGIPAYGTTRVGPWYTTADRANITLTLTYNPYTVYAQAVRCDGRALGSQIVIRGGDHTTHALTGTVANGVCFRVVLDSPTNFSFSVSGRVNY